MAAISILVVIVKIRMRLGCFFFLGEFIDVDVEDFCDGVLRGEEVI